MTDTKNEKYISFLVSLAGIGLVTESILMGWEFWVPPLIMIGVFFLWGMQLAGKPSYMVRKGAYFVFVVLVVLFHGVHETSFFDVAIVVSLAMIAFSFLDHIYMINLLFFEYFIVMGIQFALAVGEKIITFDILTVSRIILHLMIVILIYVSCLKAIRDREEARRSEEEKGERIEAYEADMEDFLSNISHELRTPVNVVNGMSEMLIKRNVGMEAESIKAAGLRLALQIEDIQDYTECKREKVLLEEEEYMSTSLINDVVMGFQLVDNSKNLELVVDLAPGVPTMMKGDVKKILKIYWHLLENAVKFTRTGGIYIKTYSENTDYGVNLCIEMTDTGIGMDRKATQFVTKGMYQVNKKRNRSSGGIGLGLFIVYGFAHRMGGFVKIESEKRNGTTIRVTLPQKVVDARPCLTLSEKIRGNILFHVRPDKYKVPKVRDFYRYMATNLAYGIHVPLYSTEKIRDIERLKEKLDVSHIFMGEEEYAENSEYFDRMSEGDIVIAVSANPGFKPNPGSRVMVMPKPLYGYPVLKILNEGREAGDVSFFAEKVRPVFRGVKALVVDDEPMNLVVARGLFKDYEMIIDTAGSGKEAIKKVREEDYDVVFMDHMMPEMDGVEAMKQIRKLAEETGRKILIIALTANAVSGAKEMFIREGFNGFIAKPINIPDFERVMLRELPASMVIRGGEKA